MAGNDLAIGGTVATAGTNTSVFFAGSNLSVNEDDGTADLTLSIADYSPSAGTSVDVTLTAGDGARVNGFTSQTVNWSANDGTDKTVTLTLTDDMLCNGNEVLTLELSNISGGQGTPFIGTPDTRTVTVNDDEVEVDPVATAATSIGTGGFDANWNSISGATGYFLDVSTFSGFVDPATTTLVEWNFPNNPDDAVADGGIAANASQTLTSAGGTGTVTYDATGASTFAATANTWTGGSGTKYWIVELDATGYADLAVSSAQRSSNTGPRDFQLEYRIGAGGTWTAVSGGAITVAADFTTGVLSDLSLPAECNGEGSVFLRWIMTSNTSVNAGTVAGGGTSRIDDVIVTGHATAFVPGYENFNAGTATSETLSGLLPATAYYYRVRAVGGCASANNSNTISVTTDPIPTYYSRATGDVTDPIWSDTPTGTAGPAVWTSASSMVVQNGHTVTNASGSVVINALTVDAGGTLVLDATTTLTTSADVTVNGTLTANDNSALVMSSTAAQDASFASTTSFWDLAIDADASCTLTGNIQVRGTLDLLDGDFDCSGGQVVLTSTATQTGRLGPVASGATYTGNMTIQRYIPAGATNWRLIGSPIEGQQVFNLQDDFFTAGYPGSHYPGFSDPPGSGIHWPSVRWYDETVASANVNAGLVGVTSHLMALDTLGTGMGFAAWSGDNLNTTAAFVIDLGGDAPVIAQTAIDLPMRWTDSGNPNADGWNLVANPLPSAIAFDALSRGADVEDFVTFYNPASGNTAVWDISLNNGTNGATNTIQSMQGFFLKASGSDATVSVDEADKVNDNGGGFFGGNVQSAVPALRLRIASEINTFSDETMVVFSEGSPALEGDDVPKYVFAAPTAPQVATLAPNGQQLAINAYGSIEEGLSIPVSVNAGVSGTYSLTVVAQGIDGLTCITLEDLLTGVITPMNDGAVYTFQLGANDDASLARFVLHATAPALLYTQDATCGGQATGEASVVVPVGPSDITWMDIGGETLLTQSGISGGVAIITGLDAGGYLVSVTAGVCGALVTEFAINAPFVLEAQAESQAASCADAEGLIDLLVLGGTAPYTFLWSDASGSTSEDLVATPGDYHVTVTDANGCAWSSEVLSIGNAGPVAEIVGVPATMQVGVPVQFQAGSADASYFWSFGDGSSSEEAAPIHSYALPGTYTVVLSVDNGDCLDATSVDIDVELSTGITEAAAAVNRAWYTPQGIVVTHAFQAGQAVRIELIDATGRVALNRTVVADRTVLATEGLANGIWFVRLTQGAQQATVRVPVLR